MIRKLHIEGFKGWKDTKEIELAPITVLFGGNSSGKSSIGQFLVMLKQTIQQSDRKTVLMLGGDKSSVNLGTPIDIFYNHELVNHLRFHYIWDLPEKFAIDEDEPKLTYSGIGFSGEIGVENQETQLLEVKELKYDLYHNEKKIVDIAMKKNNVNDDDHKYELTSKEFRFIRSRGRAWKLSEPIKFYGFPDAVAAYYQNAGFLQDINLHHENLFSKLYYLGPMRTKAKRIYTWSGVSPESVGDDGSNTIAAILSAKNQDRMLNYKKRGTKKQFLVVIAEELKKMGLISDFSIDKIENRQEYDVKVKTKGSDSYVNIPDVGFGVSQVLPVIVELFYAPENSIIFIEQPEIHLHPSAQAQLADVIIDAVNMWESGKRRNIQVILETHSEHLLRRLQRRIAEKTLSSDCLSAYFADNNKTPAHLEKLRVDEYGNIANWPEDFFGDIEEDIYQQAHHAIQRKISKKESENN